MVAFLLKDGVPEKEATQYTRDDFIFYHDKRNGYESPKPLLTVRKAEYNPDGSLKAYNRDKQFASFLENIQRKIYSGLSKDWTKAKKAFMTKHFTSPVPAIASSSSSSAYLALANAMHTE